VGGSNKLKTNANISDSVEKVDFRVPERSVGSWPNSISERSNAQVLEIPGAGNRTVD
jgi:hypothetical protein